jgi:hypothetical protein
MSNTVKSYIEVHDGGKLTVGEVNLAVHGEHPVPSDYYGACLEKSGRISIRTKWAAPVGAIAQLAYELGINVTMEFDSLDNSEVGSMQFCYKRHALEEGVSILDYYRPGEAPQWALEQAKAWEKMEEKVVTETFGIEEAE